MALEINQTYAKIGIETTPSSIQMNSEKAKLELHQKHAKINIERELPKVEIDQYEAFASSGLKNNLDLLKDTASRAYRQVMEYIEKTASDGDRLAAIEFGGSPLADIAERDAFPEKEYGLDFLPKVGPKFDVSGSIKIEAERNGEGIHNGVEINYVPATLDVNYTPGNIRIFLKEYASLNIRYHEEPKIDTRI